jgi:hypothetical protein
MKEQPQPSGTGVFAKCEAIAVALVCVALACHAKVSTGPGGMSCPLLLTLRGSSYMSSPYLNISCYINSSQLMMQHSIALAKLSQVLKI